MSAKTVTATHTTPHAPKAFAFDLPFISLEIARLLPEDLLGIGLLTEKIEHPTGETPDFSACTQTHPARSKANSRVSVRRRNTPVASNPLPRASVRTNTGMSHSLNRFAGSRIYWDNMQNVYVGGWAGKGLRSKREWLCLSTKDTICGKRPGAPGTTTIIICTIW